MKRIVLAIFALLALVESHPLKAQALPGSVQEFLCENSIRQRLGRDASYKPTFATPCLVNGQEMIDAFIEFDNRSVIADLEAHGVIVNCEFDGFVTAKIPLKLLTRVLGISGVTNVEISRVMEFCTDMSLSYTRAGQVLDGMSYGLPQPYDGSGVIIGIIDAGYDFRHYAFRDASTGKSRISRVYNSADETGHPAWVGTSRLAGSIFMGEQIDTLTTDYEGTHGTHTASIAAGTHYLEYGGMAPGAEIVLCAASSMRDGITQSEVANCMKYIYAYADSVGKPCVISVSVSTYNGIHDGSDVLARAVAQCVGPGRVFVIAAGNNAGTFKGHSRYVNGSTTMDKPLSFKLVQGHEEFDETDYSFFYSTLWTESWCRTRGIVPIFQFHILDKQTRQIVWKSQLLSTAFKTIYTTEFSDYYKPASNDTIGYLSYTVMYSNGKYGARCGLYNLQSMEYTVDENGVYDSRYQIGISVYPPRYGNPSSTNLADSCYIDSWVNASNYSYFGLDTMAVNLVDADDGSLHSVEGFYSIPDDKCTINSIAVNDSVISAGNYAAHNSYYSFYRDSIISDESAIIGDIYISSSYQQEGYGLTGAPLPTVCAPGVFVLAAGSGYSYFNIPNEWNPTLVMKGPGRYLWGVMTGTSMAAPTVAGIIAQWLQINPDLSPSQIKDVIAHTAIKDNFTTSPHFGPNGKINALAGAKYLLNLPIEELLLGDVNGDGAFNVMDVTAMIDYILTGNTANINLLNADMDQDENVNIKDATLLIDWLLSNS